MRALLLLCLTLFAGCNAWNTTKQYYDEYVNPKAEISYDVENFATIPSDFMEQFYAVDSKIARVVNLLNKNEGSLAEDQLLQIKTTYPWVSQIGLFDHVYSCMYGSVSLCNDSMIPELLGTLKAVNTTVALNFNNGVLVVNNVTSKDKQSRNIVFTLDLRALIPADSPTVAIVADGKKISGPDILGDYVAQTAELSKKKKYSDSFSKDGKKIHWIRSLASERIYYFYSK